MEQKIKRWSLGVVALLAFCFVPVVVFAIESEWHVSQKAGIDTGECCGIYSIAAAFETLGISLECRDYLSSEFIVAGFGTSVEQIQIICDLNEVAAVPLRNTNIAALKSSSYPALLNLTAGDFSKRPTGHWVAFLGVTEEGYFSIFDVGTSCKKTTIHPRELEANWQGHAVFLTPKDEQLNHSIQMSLVSALPFLIVGIFAVMSAIYLRSYFATLPAVFISSLLVCIVFVAVQDPVLKNNAAVGWIDSNFFQGSITRIEAGDFLDKLASAKEKKMSNLLMLDSRRIFGVFGWKEL